MECESPELRKSTCEIFNRLIEASKKIDTKDVKYIENINNITKIKDIPISNEKSNKKKRAPKQNENVTVDKVIHKKRRFRIAKKDEDSDVECLGTYPPPNTTKDNTIICEKKTQVFQESSSSSTENTSSNNTSNIENTVENSNEKNEIIDPEKISRWLEHPCVLYLLKRVLRC